MAAGNKDNSAEHIAQRGRIIGLWGQDIPTRDIAMNVGVSTRTVLRWISRWQEKGTLANRARRGEDWIGLDWVIEFRLKPSTGASKAIQRFELKTKLEWRAKMRKAEEKRDSSSIQKIVDDQSGPGVPFFVITKNEGQGPLSPHHVKAPTPRGRPRRGRPHITTRQQDEQIIAASIDDPMKIPSHIAIIRDNVINKRIINLGCS